MDRNKGPNAAFACVFEHRGIEYKLARHHKLDSVRDGSEHDTVDPGLLAFALRTVDQLPVTEEAREDIRQHLKDHEAALAKLAAESGDAQPENMESNDVNREPAAGNPDRAKKIINSDNDGKIDGNSTINDKDSTLSPEASAVVRKEEGTAVAVRTEGGSGSIAGGKPTEKGEKDTDAGRPKGDHQDTADINANDDVEKKSGKGTPAHPAKVSEGPKDTARPGVETDGGETVETANTVDDPADVPTSKGSKSEKTVAGPRDALPKGEKPAKKGKATDGEPTKKGKEKGDPKAQDDGDKQVNKKSKNVKKK